VSNFSLDEKLWLHNEKLNDNNNNANLCKPFEEYEIKNAIFQMEKNKAA
jgi:hypothetical protein